MSLLSDETLQFLGLLDSEGVKYQLLDNGGIHVTEDLCLSNRAAYIQALPRQLSVQGSLRLHKCPHLTALPEGLAVGRDLDLRGCLLLKSIPPDLRVGATHGVSPCFSVSGCTSLQELPAGLRLGGMEVRADGCTSLTSLPAGLGRMRFLDLSGCTSLVNLPPDLSVRASINLSGCSSLASLPKGMRLTGWMHLDGCPSLQELPSKLEVESLYLGSNFSVTGIPAGVRSSYTFTKLFRVSLGTGGFEQEVLSAVFNAVAKTYRASPEAAATALLEHEEGHWRHALALAVLRGRT